MRYLILFAYVALTAAALVLIKLSATKQKRKLIPKIPVRVNKTLVAGGILYILSFVFYTYLIAIFDLGYIIPLGTALVYILIFAASFLLFGENFNKQKVFAISLILLGILVINL